MNEMKKYWVNSVYIASQLSYYWVSNASKLYYISAENKKCTQLTLRCKQTQFFYEMGHYKVDLMQRTAHFHEFFLEDAKAYVMFFRGRH